MSDAMDISGFPLLPPEHWSLEYLKLPGVLGPATAANQARVIEVLTGAGPTSTATHTAPSAPTRARLPDPERYDGTVQNLYPFLDSLALKVQGDEHLFPDEMSKVNYGYACLSISAKNRLAIEFGYLRDPSKTPTITTFPDFFELLKRRFDDPSRRSKANGKLTKLKEGARPFHVFAVEWTDTLAHSSFVTAPDDVKISLLSDAISFNLKDKFITRPPPADATFDEYVAYCQDTDARIQDLREQQIGFRQRNSSPPGRPNQTRFSRQTSSTLGSSTYPRQPLDHGRPPRADQMLVSQGGNRMDLDSVSQEKDNDGRLTDRAKEARRRLGRCLRCNGSGHFAFQCPTGREKRQSLAVADTTRDVIEVETENEGKA